MTSSARASPTPPARQDREDGAVGEEAGRRPELSDEVLAARAAHGDPHAFERLIRRHQQHMYSVALRITGRPDDAEDAAQNGFIAAWRRLPDFRHDATFSTWLYRIVTNHALNQIRARTRSDQRSDLAALLDAEQPVSAEPGPDQHAETSALIRDLRVALAQLPPELRVCWLAREVDGYSYHEVAAITGVSFDVASGRIFRARQRLAQAMKAWR